MVLVNGASVVSVMVHPQVNSTFLFGEEHGPQVADEVVAGPGAADADEDLEPGPGVRQ
jgi:hypothetical protein